MVTRLNQFQPAIAIGLTDNTAYAPADAELQKLVTAGYCTNADLVNQVDSAKGWTWIAATRKFIPEP